MQKFGAKIRSLRQGRKLTQAQVASAIGTRQNTISEIENGTDEPTLRQVRALSVLFHVSIDSLLNDGEPVSPKTPVPD